MLHTREHLIKHGMSGSMADYLARRYINNVERNSDFYTVMDFFDQKKHASAAKALFSNDLDVQWSKKES